MNKIALWSLLALLIVACGKDPEKTMVVTGNIAGLKKGTLYLQKIQDSSLVALDSLEISGDGKFSFQTTLDSPELFYLYLKKEDKNDYNDRISFFGEAGTITINTQWNAFEGKAKISGSKTQEKLEEYRQVMSKFNTRNLELVQASSRPEYREDSIAMDSLNQLNEKNILRGYLYALNFALNNKDSEVAPFIALTEVPDANKKYLDSIYNALTPEVANSKYGRALSDYLQSRQDEE
ncbi:DUF4369 domain-containing protein [Zeaxanthinibacter enoshimensis]|uniref:Uncharacterized protein DUF4369 n=1 Tax=Zeaxanthinibacter enoshimensis TaxID=392009 RepID=A0A4R6TLZ1_9FLAO|nr:DUF4369 domain-containing protein [Zeaxanthinibacter enoshimensis]TDQ30838.1 uncharacterized protein DUF4369 [Zeaxanthinibacter enoshimensis]